MTPPMLIAPGGWAIEHRAEVEVTVSGATPAARNALLDALLVDLAAAIPRCTRFSVPSNGSRIPLPATIMER